MTPISGTSPWTASRRTAGRGDRRLFLLSGYACLGLTKEHRILAKAIRSLDDFGLGVYPSRMMGSLSIHDDLEREISSTNGAEASITFPSGYQANVAATPALVNSDDVIISDELNHASIIDGSRLSGARYVTYRHAGVDDLKDKLETSSQAGFRDRLVISDAIFSMDGDIAPLPAICPGQPGYSRRSLESSEGGRNPDRSCHG